MRVSATSYLTAIITAVFSVFFFCSCNVPETVPTSTPAPEQTTENIPATTPTPKHTPTVTPKPEYLDISPEEVTGAKLILVYDSDGRSEEKITELADLFNEENDLGITIIAVHGTDAEIREILEGNNAQKTDILIADSALLRSPETHTPHFIDLSGFLDSQEYAFVSDETNAIMPIMLEAENQNGKYYALPLWVEPAFLFYNKTWAIELGYDDTPTDLTTFAEQVCAAGKANYAEKDNNKHGTGGWLISSDATGVLSWMLVFAQDGEHPSDFFHSETGEVFTDTASWLRDLYDNGCAWNSRVKEPYDYFANRYALFYSGTYSDAERQFNAFAQSESYSFDNWDLIPYPVKTNGSKDDPRIYADMISIAIPDNMDARQANAAWQFIRWLYSEKHAAEVALSANGWPVQDNEEITTLYRKSGKDKLYQTLSYRQYFVNNNADENWLTSRMILSDGFSYVFNPSAKPEDIPEIWKQIGDVIDEINSVNNNSENNTFDTTIETGVKNETQS